MPRFVRRGLLWKYAVHLSALVSALLVVSGAVGTYFVYREAVASVERSQGAQAQFAATEMANFMSRLKAALRGSVDKFDASGLSEAEHLRIELVSLLRHHPEISELRWIGGGGRELFALLRYGLGTASRGRDWSDDPRFIGAHDGEGFVGRVYFRKESEPYVSISVAQAVGGGVLLAEVNLKHVWDVMARARQAAQGQAFVVDRDGLLISHPDIGLVLAKTDLSSLPQVRRMIDPGAPAATLVGAARDLGGAAVVSAAARVEGLPWTVFAEQPVAQALQPVYASVARSLALVALGVLAAVAASVLLARRMVRPIHSIESGARLLADGRYDQRIELHTGDELEALASQFNVMADRLEQVHDTQERRIAERTHALAVANAAKTRFLAAASHDLRQPVHALALFAGQLRAVELSGPGAALAHSIERSAAALQTLVEALLDLSQLDGGAVAVRPRAFAVSELLARIELQFGSTAEARGVGLTVVPCSLSIRSDPMLLERILQNLISNALRYTRQGRVLVGCRRHGDEVEIVVADTGIGIEPEHLPRVFDEFYRAGRTPVGRDAGLGLGLAIVSRLALALGHRVSIDSAPGRGTVVRVRVPRETAQGRPSAPALAVEANLAAKRVLVVDDEAGAREALRTLLASWDCKVDTAEGADEALERVRARRPDVVLCDLQLGGGELGTEVVDRLNRVAGASLRCAFVTGESSPELIALARATGHPIICKPASPAKLRAVLEHLTQAA